MKAISLKLVLLALLLQAGLSLAEPKAKARDFVDVADISPGIVVDLAYARENNFFGRRFYAENRCRLRRATAMKLHKVQLELEKSGFRLKILDGYRPPSVQRELWKVKPDPRYVAHPDKGSRHNRGAAVDVTLVKADGSDVPMPTGFDDFSEKAASHYTELPPEVLRNRKLLQDAMTRHGFTTLASEWWHFDDSDWKAFPVEEINAAGQAAAPGKKSVAGKVESAPLPAPK